MNADIDTAKVSSWAVRTFLPNAPQRVWDHRFYTGISLAIAAVVFAGFGRTYYLKAAFHTPQLSQLLHVHGAISTLWIVLYVAQNLLILNGKVSTHRRLGWALGALAVLLLILAVPVAIGSVKRGHFAPANDAYTSLLAFSFRNLFNFALLLGASIYWRRDAETHKRLALLAVVALFSDPAIGRLPISSPLILLLLFVAFHIAGPVYDLVVRHRIHRVYWWGVPYLLISIVMAIVVAQSRAWHAIADWLMR
jgi:hypothetical protein